MSLSRRKNILDAEVLLIVRRPDAKSISVLRAIFGIVFILFWGWFLLVARAPWNYKLAASGAFLGLYITAFWLAINTFPIVLTEKGIAQRFALSLYWHEIEGFTWLPWSKNFLRLDLQPSGEAPVFTQISQIKGSYRNVPCSWRADMERIFQMKGLREIVW